MRNSSGNTRRNDPNSSTSRSPEDDGLQGMVREYDKTCRSIRRVTILDSFSPLWGSCFLGSFIGLMITVSDESKPFSFATLFQWALLVTGILHLLIQTIGYSQLRSKWLNSHYGKWKSGLFYSRRSLIEFFNPRWLLLLYVIPFTLALLAPGIYLDEATRLLWDKLPPLFADNPSFPYLFVPLSTIGFCMGVLSWYAELRASSFRYRRRVAPQLPQRETLMKAFAQDLELNYTDRSMEFYPVKWEHLEGERGKVAQLKANAWDIITERIGDPCYDIWRSSSYGYPYNIVNGRRKDEKIVIFDYHDATDIRFPISKNAVKILEREITDFSVVTLKLDTRMPNLVIYPEEMLDKFAKQIGCIDIDLESFEFSEKYRVWCVDRRFAFDACTVLIMEFLMDHPRLALKIQDKCISVRFPEWAPPEELRACADQLIAKRSRIIGDRSRAEASRSH